MRRAIVLALALAVLPCAHAAEELRTLFFSAQEREQLDRLRRGEPPQEIAKKRAAPVVSGYVKRSDGRDTAWVDGHAVTGAEARKLADPAQLRDSRGERRIEIRPSR